MVLSLSVMRVLAYLSALLSGVGPITFLMCPIGICHVCSPRRLAPIFFMYCLNSRLVIGWYSYVVENEIYFLVVSDIGVCEWDMVFKQPFLYLVVYLYSFLMCLPSPFLNVWFGSFEQVIVEVVGHFKRVECQLLYDGVIVGVYWAEHNW